MASTAWPLNPQMPPVRSGSTYSGGSGASPTGSPSTNPTPNPPPSPSAGPTPSPSPTPSPTPTPTPSPSCTDSSCQQCSPSFGPTSCSPIAGGNPGSDALGTAGRVAQLTLGSIPGWPG